MLEEKKNNRPDCNIEPMNHCWWIVRQLNIEDSGKWESGNTLSLLLTGQVRVGVAGWLSERWGEFEYIKEKFNIVDTPA